MIPRDGKMYKKHRGKECVGVLVSGGYGAGWSTWNPEFPECLFAPEIVHILEAYRNKKLPQHIITEISTLAERKWPDGYWGGAEYLSLVWLPVGTKFRITEYDGAEGLETIDSIQWTTA